MINLKENIREEIQTFCDNCDAESVGVVLEERGRQVFMPFTNISDSAIIHYVAEPQEFYDLLKNTTLFGGKKKIVCFVHSHPTGIKNPSGTDIEHAYHNYPYLIYYGNGFTCFIVKGNKVKVEAI